MNALNTAQAVTEHQGLDDRLAQLCNVFERRQREMVDQNKRLREIRSGRSGFRAPCLGEIQRILDNLLELDRRNVVTAEKLAEAGVLEYITPRCLSTTTKAVVSFENHGGADLVRLVSDEALESAQEDMLSINSDLGKCLFGIERGANLHLGYVGARAGFRTADVRSIEMLLL